MTNGGTRVKIKEARHGGIVPGFFSQIDVTKLSFFVYFAKAVGKA